MKAMKVKIFSFILLVTLVAIPIAGCGNSSPVASFSYTPAAPAAGDAVLFSDSSSDSDGSITSWAWDFGDGNTSSTQNPTHSYTDPGSYAVELTVTDDGGASDSCEETVTVTVAPPELDKWDAIGILVEEIIPPAASEDRISAFMFSEPLVAGDVVTPERSTSYNIDTNTWFIFIDDEPEAEFVHATRYVFIDARTGDYEIFDEGWPPLINDYSMWNAQGLERGHLIELWSVLDVPLPLTPVASNAPEADYGDAPDGQDAYYGIPGHFPTLYNTANSHFNLPGGHTLNVGEETLGLRVSAEIDALDPNDPDGMPNLVDSDKDERIYVIVEEDEARLAFTVSVSLGAPDMTRYANALIDFDYSGNWSESALGEEWVTVNLAVDVDPGDSETIMTPLFDWANPTPPPSAVWMRLALTRSQVDESLFANVGGWDGSGQFAYGEIEDHFAFLTDMPPVPDWDTWPPPPPNGNGNGNGPPPINGDGNGDGIGDGIYDPTPPLIPRPGPETGACGYKINYYYLIINCGDNGKSTHMKGECDRLESLFKSQGYGSGDYLKPSTVTNTLANIKAKLQAIKDKVNCADRVMIAIKGHGDGSIIGLHDSSGKDIGEITPAQINSWLDIPECDGKECNVEKECCFVDIVISSCHAKAFLDTLKRKGRTVAVSSTAGVSWGGSGGYTTGFIKDMRSFDSDTDPKDGYVTAKEAHKTAAAHQKTNHKKADADISAQQCDCTCPCQASIDVEKWIWLDYSETWGKEMEAELGQTIPFLLEIDNDGVCRDVIDLELVDLLPTGLSYGGEAALYYNGTLVGYRSPDSTVAVSGGTELTWILPESEIGALSPEDSIALEYYAYVEYPGILVNTLYGSAHCSYNYDNVVTGDDSVFVLVQEEQEPEVVLEGSLYAYRECSCINYECVGCTSTVTLTAEDTSEGDIYPVTYVALYVDGEPFYSENTSTSYYQKTFQMSVNCYDTTTVTMVVRNSIGLEDSASVIIDTTSPCQESQD